MSASSLRLTFLILATTSLASTGCGLAARVTNLPATATAARSEEPPPSDCYGMSTIHTPIPPAISHRGSVSANVLVGDFDGLGEPYWDTADGRRPTRDEVGSGHARILTPVVLDIERELKGTSRPAGTATIYGGQIGCDVFRADSNPVLDLHSRYVFFLADVLTERGGTVPRLLEAWPVDSNDVVATPLDGELTLDEIDSALDRPPSTPGQETPFEPPDGFPEGADAASTPPDDASSNGPSTAP